MKRIALIFAVLASLAGCHSSEKPDNQTLVVGLNSSPTTLDPRFATDANSQRIDDLIFSSLVRNGPDLKPVPQAATSWTVEPRKITFKLTKGLKFQSGRPLNAADVVYSINEYARKGTPFASTLAAVTEALAPDEGTVILKLKEDDASLLTNLNDIKILPKESVQKWGEAFAQHPEGSGPYQFISSDNNHVLLKKAEGCPYAAPKIEKLLFKVVRDDSTRYLKLLKGDLDAVLNDLPEEKVMEIKREPGIEVYTTPGLNFNYLLFNLKSDKLKNLKTRQAFMNAINRDEIIKYKLEGLAAPATSIIAPASPFSAPKLKFSRMTLEQAKDVIKEQHLEGAGFSLKCSTQGLPNAQLIAEQLEQLGIKVRLQSYDWGTYYSDVKAGRFEMAIMRWVGIVDPDVYRDTLASTEFPPGRNRGYYSNKTFDALVEKARHEINFDKRRQMYFNAEQIIADDLPIVPLWYNSNISVLNKRVKNFKPVITGSFYPFIDVTKE